MVRGAAVLLVALPLAEGHGGMVKPSTWMDPTGYFTKGPHGISPQARETGCTGQQAPGEVERAQGCLAEWYTNYTFIPGKPTISARSPLLTLQNYGGLVDWTAKNPWRAPGTAPIFSPCGVDGGNPKGCPVGNRNPDGCAAGGYGYGPDARTLPGNEKPVEWTAGSVVEVAWSIVANHGGGYQYRLCPLPAGGRQALTEECFQQTPLDFVSDTQWAQYDNGTRVAFKAMRTAEGTTPAGSTWTRNPVPGCLGDKGAPFANGADGKCSGPQFEPPVPGLFGFAPGIYLFAKMPGHSIVDQVWVPAGISPGDYVLSFRYDCEQTSQVWQQCGDVRISAASVQV